MDLPQYEYQGLIAEAWDVLRGDTSQWPDRPFYLEMIRRTGQPVLDVGCGAASCRLAGATWPGRRTGRQRRPVLVPAASPSHLSADTHVDRACWRVSAAHARRGTYGIRPPPVVGGSASYTGTTARRRVP
jgi:hypothetical protein